MCRVDIERLLSELSRLNLPKGEYAIFGSGPMAIRKIRETNDLDIVVKKQQWEKLVKKYNKKLIRKNEIRIGNISIFRDWHPWITNPDEIVETAEMIQGFPFVRLEDVIALKEKMGREKDRRDILKIRRYLRNNKAGEKDAAPGI